MLSEEELKEVLKELDAILEEEKAMERKKNDLLERIRDKEAKKNGVSISKPWKLKISRQHSGSTWL